MEAAYFGLAYCLVYRVEPLSYLMAKLLVKIKFIGIVNILAGKEVVREFIQADANAGAVSDALKDFLQSPEKRANLQARLAETTAKLGGSGAHERAARVVAAWLAGTGEAG